MATIVVPWLRHFQAGGGPPLPVSLVFLGANLGTSYLLAVVSWHLFQKTLLRQKVYFPYQVSSPVSSEGRIVPEPKVPEWAASDVTS